MTLAALTLHLEARQALFAQHGTEVDLGDLVVSSDRIPRITAPDAVPADTANWPVVDYVGAPTESAVAAAIQALDSRTVLVLPPGDYTGHLTLRRSEIVVRGDCTDISAVRWVNEGNPQNPLFSPPLCAGGIHHDEACWNGDADCPGGFCDPSQSGTLCTAGWFQLCGAETGDRLSDILSQPFDWSGPYSRGSTALTVHGADEIAEGDQVWVASDPFPGPGEVALTDDFNWIGEVVHRNGEVVELAEGLPIDFHPEGNPRIRRIRKAIRSSGIECMTLAHSNPADPEGLYSNLGLTVRYAWNSWLRRVDLGDTFNVHALIERSGRTLLLSNRFGEQHKSLAGDGQTCGGAVETNPCWNKHAVIYVESHSNSFVNNTVHASIGVEIAHSSSRNWIAYNYFPEPELHPAGEPRRALFPHGNYGHSNVFEGNLFWGVGEMDVIWGSQGPRYVWFRNVALNPLGRLSNEAWAGAPDPFPLSRDASYLLNRADLFGHPNGDEIDTRSIAMHLERNVFDSAFHVGDPTASETTAVHNLNRSDGDPSELWQGLQLPSTLNQALGASPPSFWCANEPICRFDIRAGVGAFWDGECLLPAQTREAGIECVEHDEIFTDGFESGATSEWSATVVD